MKYNISVIILTCNESIHIERCILNAKKFSNEIFVVDSFSDDDTVDKALNLGAKVYSNKWENNYSKQFNWALDNLPISNEWVLRLDADEYLTEDLINELNDRLPTLNNNISGVIFKRRHYLFSKWIKRGVYPVKLLRLFRYRLASCESRFMDEHIVLNSGASIEFEYDFIDENLNNFSWWSVKHVNYSIREAVDLLDIKYNLSNSDSSDMIGLQAASKRKSKIKYSKLPLFLRPTLYFVYRYFICLGFIEGKESFIWHFFQGWWYRMLVDVKLYEINKVCGSDVYKIKKYILDVYKIKIN